jgi:hypothetical protein
MVHPSVYMSLSSSTRFPSLRLAVNWDELEGDGCRLHSSTDLLCDARVCDRRMSQRSFCMRTRLSDAIPKDCRSESRCLLLPKRARNTAGRASGVSARCAIRSRFVGVGRRSDPWRANLRITRREGEMADERTTCSDGLKGQPPQSGGGPTSWRAPLSGLA